MALVSLPEPEQMNSPARETVEAGAAQYGQVLQTWRAISHRPEIMAAYLPYLKAVAGPGVVDQRLKELTALEVTLLNRCRYSCSHRVRAGRAAGVGDDDLAALGRGDIGHFPERERVALEFAAALTVDPPRLPTEESEAAVPERLLAMVKERFDEPELVELALNVSLWNALTRFHRVMGFEYDMDPVPESLEPRF